jgi:prolyl-tRNA editing enzyme YbaK/EbsC (Cys-tRNA(Pro) deacylase)
MINLPTIEETTRSYKVNNQIVEFELIELDELHKTSAQIASKNKTDFYNVFNTLLNDKKKVTLSKAAIFLILSKKASDFEELKKRLSDSEPLLSPLDAQDTSTEEE